MASVPGIERKPVWPGTISLGLHSLAFFAPLGETGFERR